MSLTGKLNLTGLALGLVGVVFLFFFGMPFHVPTGGVQHLITEQLDQHDIQLEHRYTILGWIGLFMLLLGTCLQMWAVVRAERKVVG